jgi:transcriptional regulator with GAF, ATPase, and Fis domain
MRREQTQRHSGWRQTDCPGRVRWAALQSAYLREEIKATHNFEETVGQSSALTDVLRRVELVAATEATVLVFGETGTGKELIARAIHARSARQERPLIKVNCAALPAGLIESELFGHEKGALHVNPSTLRSRMKKLAIQRSLDEG